MRWTATLLLLLTACDWPGQRAEPEPTIQALRPAPAIARAGPQERQAWLELYGEVGYPDVSTLQRVEFEGAGGEPERAWALSTAPLVLLMDAMWTIAPEDCSPPEVMRAPSEADEGAPARQPPAYRAVDFSVELEAELDAVEALTPSDDAYRRDPTSDGPRVVHWLVRARWAQMRGLPELSRRALAQVERWMAVDCALERCSPELVLRAGLAARLLQQARVGIDRFMPWPQARELVARAHAVAPPGAESEEAALLLEQLDRTLAQDAAGPPWARASDEAGQLVGLLREHRRYASALCPPFEDSGHEVRNPYAELTALGHAAIPALIEHLDDETATRTLYDGRLRSVGELCVDIIGSIAGRDFRVSEAGESSDAGQAGADRQRVREWWAGARELSERDQLLRDLGSVPENHRPWIADLLLTKYGMEIWPELLRAFAQIQDDDPRYSLLYTIAHHPTQTAREREMVDRFLIEALEDRSAYLRVRAAEALIERGRDEGIETVIHELDRYWLNPQAWGPDNLYERYFSVLLSHGSAAAVDAVTRALERRGPEAMDAVWRADCYGPQPCAWPLDPAAKARLLDVLAQSMAVLDDDPTDIGGWERGRVRDRAASAYVAVAGLRSFGAYTNDATSLERDRMILALLDAHHAERGLAPVSWEHVAQPPSGAGRDRVQRVHLLHAASHESDAREWLERYVGGELVPQQITADLVELAQRHRDVSFVLRIHRLPDAGVILTLEVGPRQDPSGRELISWDASCVRAECSNHVASAELEHADGAFEDFLAAVYEVWDREPEQPEEYVLRVVQTSEEPRVLAVLRWVSDRLSGRGQGHGWGALVLLAGLAAAGLAAARRRRRESSQAQA